MTTAIEYYQQMADKVIYKGKDNKKCTNMKQPVSPSCNLLYTITRVFYVTTCLLYITCTTQLVISGFNRYLL